MPELVPRVRHGQGLAGIVDPIAGKHIGEKLFVQLIAGQAKFSRQLMIEFLQAS